MPTEREDHLRDMMRAKAAHASLSPDVVHRAMGQGRRRRARRHAVAGGTTSLAVAVVAVGALYGTWGGQPSTDRTTTATAPTPSDQSTPADGALHSERQAQSPTGTSTFPLPYRDDSDTFSYDAYVKGTLVQTDDDCLAIATPIAEAPVSLVWPTDWTAQHEDGVIVVYDAQGHEVAREGRQVGLVGGFTSRYEGRPCTTGRPWSVSEALDEGPAGDDDADSPYSNYIRDFGVSEAEAEKRLQMQRAFGDLSELVRQAAPERYAAKLLDHEGDFELTIRFTGDDVPAEAAAIVAESFLPVSLESGARYTDSEARAVMQPAIPLLNGHPGVNGLSYYPRDEVFVLDMVGDPADEDDEEVIAELRANLPDGLPEEIAEARIELGPRATTLLGR